MFRKGKSGLSSVVQPYLMRAAQHLGVPSVVVRGVINKKKKRNTREMMSIYQFLKCLNNVVHVKK